MSIFKSFEKLNPEPVVEYKSANLFIPQETRFSLLLASVSNIDSKSDDEIKYLLYQEHTHILNYDLFLLHNETRKVLQNLFSNNRFLKIFLSVLGYLNLTRHEIICLNKLAYDYYLLDDTEKDSEVRDLLLMISYEVNKKQVIQLSAILGINRARLLSLIANSSFKQEKCIRRICKYLLALTDDPEYQLLDITVQKVIDIILIFTDTHYTTVFITIMTDADNITIDSDEKLNMYNMISEACIVILQSMTSDDIHKVLSSYANYLKLQSVNTRFKMYSITKGIEKDKYPRVTSIVNAIEIGDEELQKLW